MRKIPYRQLTSIGRLTFFLRFLFIWGIILFTIGSSVYLGWNEQSIEVGLVDFGDKTLGSLSEASESAKLFIESPSYYRFLILVFNSYKIFLWLYVVKLLVDFLLRDANTPAIRWIISIGIWILFQITYFALSGINLNTLITSWINLFDAYSLIFSGQSGLLDWKNISFFELKNSTV